MASSILVVAAHPDDEVLGCGGAMATFAAQGAMVHVAFLADGVGSRGSAGAGGGLAPEEELALDDRRAAARRAGEILAVSSMSFDDLPDNRLDSVPLLDITQRVEALVAEHRPEMLMTHHAGDLNVDHRRVHQAVVTACRPQTGHPVQTLLTFEVPSSTEWQPPGSGEPFVPNWFIDIGATLQQKLDALDAYAAELRDWPHPRSRRGVEYLARWRGATVGCEAAEGFVLARALR
jgi:N-acetylglucosamine malate deacetylase 1